MKLAWVPTELPLGGSLLPKPQQFLNMHLKALVSAHRVLLDVTICLSDPPQTPTATLVLGPSTAALIYDDPNGEDSYKESCGISDGVASCEAAIVYTGDYYGVFGGVNGYTISLYGTDVDYSVTTTIHWTETAQVYAVEGGSAVSVVTTTNAAGETLVVPTSAMSSSRSSGSSTPTSTTTAGSVSNGAGGTKHTSSASMVVGIVCAAAINWLM